MPPPPLLVVAAGTFEVQVPPNVHIRFIICCIHPLNVIEIWFLIDWIAFSVLVESDVVEIGWVVVRVMPLVWVCDVNVVVDNEGCFMANRFRVVEGRVENVKVESLARLESLEFE